MAGKRTKPPRRSALGPDDGPGGAPAAGSGDAVVKFHQGKKPTFVEQVGDALAVRFRQGGGGLRSDEADSRGAVEAAAQTLGRLGEVTPAPSERVLVVRFRDRAAREAAERHLRDWERQGLVEFATPVLRDRGSQLRQILTDEITLRLKPCGAGRLEQVLGQLSKDFGLTVARRNEFVPNQFVLKVPDAQGLKTLELADRLDAEDAVEFAAPNFISEVAR